MLREPYVKIFAEFLRSRIDEIAVCNKVMKDEGISPAKRNSDRA